MTKNTVCFGTALSEQSHHGEPREDRSLKPAVAVPASFPVWRRVGYITAQDMPECWMHHYSKAYAGPSLHSGHFLGGAPFVSRPIRHGWAEKRQSFEPSSGDA